MKTSQTPRIHAHPNESITSDADLLAALDRAARAFGDRGEGPVLRAAAARIRELTTPTWPLGNANAAAVCGGGAVAAPFTGLMGGTFITRPIVGHLTCYGCGAQIVAGDDGKWRHQCPPWQRTP